MKELKQKVQKDARDHQFQKTPKICKRDKDDVLEERKTICVQVGPSMFSKPVFSLPPPWFKIIVCNIGAAV